MRRLDPEMQRRLDGGATTLCRCWRVRRRDGVTLGFTDHDADLRFEETVFRASTGMNATAVQTTTGLAVDNAEAVGALSGAGISEEDVQAGRFDRASVENWLVDWTNPGLRVRLFSGSFGEIRRTDGAFEVELRGLTEPLNAAVGRTLGRFCDRRLGDPRCGFNLSDPRFSTETEVEAGSGLAHLRAPGLTAFAEAWFASGEIVWLSGANIGEFGSVKRDTMLPDGLRRLDLWREPGAPVAQGDRFRIFAGCDKRLETCRDKFRNLLNFRGFPHIPGDDWVAAYPRNGEVHDGASRRGA